MRPDEAREPHSLASVGGRRGFRDALCGEGVSIIAEIKRRSPSRGGLRVGADAVALARSYEAGGAACVVGAHRRGALRRIPPGSARRAGCGRCSRAAQGLPDLRAGHPRVPRDGSGRRSGDRGRRCPRVSGAAARSRLRARPRCAHRDPNRVGARGRRGVRGQHDRGEPAQRPQGRQVHRRVRQGRQDGPRYSTNSVRES